MIKPIYTIPATAPMKFYKFITSFALPVGIFMGIAQFFSQVASVSSNKLYLIDAFFTIVHVILLFLTWGRIRDMKWSGVQFYYVDLLWSIGYNLFGIVFSLAISNSDVPANYIATATAQTILLLLYWVYFSKRRLLFSPVPSNSEYSIYQVDDEAVVSLNEETYPIEATPIQNSSAEPVSLQPEELDTLSTQASNKGRISVSVPIFVFLISVLCVSAGVIGYICYSTGYNTGNDAGYEIGHKSGYDEGHSKGYSDAESKYSKTITNLRDEIDEFDEKIASLQEYSDFLENYFDDTIDEWAFFHDYSVIVTTTGSKYHHYGCSHLDGHRYYIYNIELAESKGYAPCLDCWDK